MSDNVNHPSHYTSGKIEVIEFIEDQNMDFHLANATKYICRAGKKDPLKEVEDLQKAIWYIQRYIDKVAEPRRQQAVEKAKEDLRNMLRKDSMKIFETLFPFQKLTEGT